MTNKNFIATIEVYKSPQCVFNSITNDYVSTLSPNLTHASFYLAFNPGGNVPGWIVNLFVNNGSLDSFRKLKQKMSVLNK
jgi:hypothetical protein